MMASFVLFEERTCRRLGGNTHSSLPALGSYGKAHKAAFLLIADHRPSRQSCYQRLTADFCFSQLLHHHGSLEQAAGQIVYT